MNLAQRIQEELESPRFLEAANGGLLIDITKVFIQAAGVGKLTGEEVNPIAYLMAAAHIGMIAEREGWCLDEHVGKR